jgi:TRAP-type C4-dicarboxylate transport system permease small subunit
MPTRTWKDSGAEITFYYTQTVASTGFGTQYVLTDVNATSPLTIIAPIQIKAIYESQTILFTVAGSALLLFLLLLLLFLIIAARRRKKKKQEQNANTASPPSIPKL